MPKTIKLSCNKKNWAGAIYYRNQKKKERIIEKIDNGVKSIMDYNRKTENGDRVWSF